MFVPTVREGDGIGHLRRCLELLHSFPNGSLLLEGLADDERERVQRVASSAHLDVPEDRLIADLTGRERWKLVVLDRRSTTLDELDRFLSCGPVVGIDEGGDARERIPYLIDTLPSPPERSKANIFSPAFQSRPTRRRLPGEPKTGRVLITFGGEDPEGLSTKMIEALIEGGHYSATEITLVVGPLFREQHYRTGIEVLHAPSDLREQLRDYDVVFTSFGLTAYEAVNAGTAAVLFNPTSYHRTLARIAGFPEVGVGTIDHVSLKRQLADGEALLRRCATIASGAQKSLSDHLAELDFSSSCRCPVCGERRNVAVGRFLDRSFFRCGGCSMVYELDFSSSRQDYGASYFFEDYRAQYGKTYLEDFDTIRGFAAVRVERMESVGGAVAQRRLLDVGCAFGPFLLEAGKRGAEVYGVDVAEEAVAHVRAELRLPCAEGSFEELDLAEAFGVETVDFVTMWYVIEHFPRLGAVLRKVNRLLPVGGIFAFSTPNTAGVSGRNDLEQFLSNSPRDHFTLWDPRIARRVLTKFGFQVREVHITGHHPERFPKGGATGGWKYKLLRRYSELARLGDTFECYAVKESETG